MQRDQLKEWDPHFKVISSHEDFDLLGIMGLEAYEPVRSKHVIFLKDKKYAQKCLNLLNAQLKNKDSNSSDTSKLGCVIDHVLWDNLSEKDDELVNQLPKLFAWIGTTENIDLCLNKTSHQFYKERFGKYNDVIDGRQMGTASVHPTSWVAQGVFIGDEVKIDEGVKIHPGVVIMGGCEIGRNTEIFPNATLYYNVKVGAQVRIHSGTTLGADGFGYNHQKGVHLKIWHVGSVEVGDEVEIGSNCNIDSGTFSPTRIGAGTKIDNHVQIGHNSQIGKGVIICGQVGISGSNIIGDFCVFGGKAGTADNIEVGAGCQIAGNGMVTNSWPAGSVIAGHPARPLKEWMRGNAYLRKLSLGEKAKKVN